MQSLVENEQSEIRRLHGVVERLRYAATHDQLTGLGTREVLLEKLSSTVAASPSCSSILIISNA
jgi:GGDEF domain-containing protein